MLRRSLVREVRARLGQLVAVVVTIFLGVAIFGASYDAYENLNASYNGLYERLDFADLTITGGDPAVVVSAVRAQPEVAAVTTRAVAERPLELAGRRIVARLVGMPVEAEPAVNRVLVLRGGNLDPGRPDGVLLEQHVASHYRLEPGASVSVRLPDGWSRLDVLGVVASPEYLWPARSRQEILVTPDDFGVLFVPQALVTGLPPADRQAQVLVRLAPDAGDGTLDRVRSAALAAGAASAIDRSEQASNAALQEDVSGFGEMALMFPLLFLGAGALAMSVLLGRLVASQRPQIGTLLAAGFRRRTILGHYLAFGLLVGVAGSVPGAIVGALAAAGISHLYTAVIAVPITVVDVRAETVATGLVIGPLAGALAALGPARRAARLSPAVAMGGFAPTPTGRRSLLERLLPPVGRLPARWLTALRGLGRNRRRSITTVLGVALAAMLVVVGWGMMDTVTVLLDRQFRVVARQDAEIYLERPMTAAEALAAVRVPGVADAEPTIELPVAVGHGEARYGTTLAGLRTDTTMHTFTALGGGTQPLPENGILLGRALRERLGIDVGDEVVVAPSTAVGETAAVATAAGPSGSGTRIRVAGFVDEPLGTFAYASLGTVGAIAGVPPGDDGGPGLTTAVLVRFEPGVDRGAMRDSLSSAPGVAAYVDNRSLYELAQSLMGLFYAFIGVMLALGGVMAFALIYNTLSANVAERSVELAALRTLGMSRRTLGWLVTAENVLLTVIGLVPGLIGGYVLAAVFMATFSSDLFRFDLVLLPTTPIGVAIAILIAALASQLPALRSIGRLDLATIARQRAL